MRDHISSKQFREAEGVEAWRVLGDGACAFFRTASFAAAVRFVEAIGKLPDVDDHRPEIDIRNDGVTVRLITITDDWYWLTKRDLDLARPISVAARASGLEGDPSRLQSMFVIPGATDRATVMPFWRAALAYEPRRDSPDEDLVDPGRRGPAFWFENMNEPRPGGLGAIHLVAWVPYEQAQLRIAAALAAGGRMVHDDHAPEWWTLADPAGNEVDIATTMDRESASRASPN
ncbi:MAG TPA: VOC family protein [Candidatus Limnocylindria bacterium]